MDKFITRHYKASISSASDKNTNPTAVETELLIELLHWKTVRYMLNIKDKPPEVAFLHCFERKFLCCVSTTVLLSEREGQKTKS